MTLPVLSPPFEGTSEGAGAVGGILLAAGTSDRYGDRNKLLATVDGEPLVRHAARTLVRSVVDPVVVVGHESDRVTAALEGFDLAFVHNSQFETGQASSVRTGVAALRERRPDADAAAVALGDMPFVDPGTVDRLVAAHEAGAGDALAAAHEGQRGNPVLFDRRYFDDLTAVEGDIGGRQILLEGEDSALIEVSDPGVRRDVDEPSDLE